MPYANKAYVAFDADNDIRYYRLMQAWKKIDGSSFGFYDAHDLTNIMSWSSEETIKSSLRERLKNTKVFLILIGDRTKYHHKFVRWEIEQAIKMDIPIIAVNLNGKRKKDTELCPAVLNDKLVLHVSFNKSILQKAIGQWPNLYVSYKRDGNIDDFSYNSSVYQSLGL